MMMVMMNAKLLKTMAVMKMVSTVMRMRMKQSIR